MRPIVRLLIALAALLALAGCQSPGSVLTPVATRAQSPASSTPPSAGAAWQVWPAAVDPLAVYALATDGDVLWAGTSFGVWRVDLATGAFTRYEDIGMTFHLLPAEGGRAWAIGRHGVYYFDGRAWSKPEFSSSRDSLYLRSVSVLGTDLAGDLWLQSGYSRSVRWLRFPGHVPPASGPWQEVERRDPPSFDVTDCSFWQSFTAYGNTYRSTDECLALKQARQAVERVTQAFGLIAIDADGSTWWGGGQTLGHWVNGSLTTLELPVVQVYALAADPTAGVWIGSEQGLAHFDGASLRWMPLGLSEYTLRGSPYGMTIDAQGKVWVATSSGLLTLAPNDERWQPVTDTGVPGPQASLQVLMIAAAPDGGVWATHGYDLWRFGGETVVPPVAAQFDGGCTTLSQLAVDPVGDVWAAAPGCGVILQYSVSTGEWIQHRRGSWNTAVTVGADGKVYVSGSDGIYVHTTASEWKQVVPANSESDAAFAVDRSGGVWVVWLTTGELWYYLDGHGQLSGRRTKPYALTQLHVDAQSRLWITDGETLSRYDGRDWRDMALPRFGSIVQRMLEAPDGRIWLAGDEGVAVYDPAREAQP